jgi:hypothetical protein
MSIGKARREKTWRQFGVDYMSIGKARREKNMAPIRRGLYEYRESEEGKKHGANSAWAI